MGACLGGWTLPLFAEVRQPDPIHNLPLLRITDACRVQPVGELVGGTCRMMPYERCGEVLRGACALTLGDEPLSGGVEYAALEFRIELPKPGLALHHSVNCQIGK